MLHEKNSVSYLFIIFSLTNELQRFINLLITSVIGLPMKQSHFEFEFSFRTGSAIFQVAAGNCFVKFQNNLIYSICVKCFVDSVILLLVCIIMCGNKWFKYSVQPPFSKFFKCDNDKTKKIMLYSVLLTREEDTT